VSGRRDGPGSLPLLLSLVGAIAAVVAALFVPILPCPGFSHVTDPRKTLRMFACEECLDKDRISIKQLWNRKRRPPPDVDPSIY